MHALCFVSFFHLTDIRRDSNFQTTLVLDPSSFAKAKINDRGIAALAYNVLLRPGVTLGLGASFDTQNLNQAAHKVGASFTFEG